MKVGFTLAEVLITLGIIGVVAAITIPPLVQNYQKKTWVEGLRVGMSIFEQGFKKAMADDGVDDLRNTELFKACDGATSEHTSNYQLWSDDCKPLLGKYFKDIKFESVPDMQALGDTTNITTDTAKCKQLVGKTNKWWYLNDKTKCRGWKNMAVTLINGMRADFALEDYGYFAGTITALDINGGKGPNTWGRDTFYLNILPDGHVVPGAWGREKLKAWALYNGRDVEQTIQTYLPNYLNKCTSTTTEDGSYCSVRIIEDGWKMNY